MDSWHDKAHFSELPDDICRIVFERVAEDRKDALSCALVSRKVQSWVEPIIYRHVELRDEPITTLFHRTISTKISTKPEDFFAVHVKGVIINTDPEPSEPCSASLYPAILKTCCNVRTLGSWIHQDNIPTDLQAVLMSSLLSPTRLAISRFLFPPGRRTFAHPIFEHVTHLDLFQEQLGDLDYSLPWDTLEGMKHLTHLCVSLNGTMMDSPATLAGEILSMCPPSLNVLILFFTCCVFCQVSPNRTSVEIKALHDGDLDMRAVAAHVEDTCNLRGGHKYGVTTSITSLLTTWNGDPASNKEKDLWRLADDVVALRRRHREEGLI